MIWMQSISKYCPGAGVIPASAQPKDIHKRSAKVAKNRAKLEVAGFALCTWRSVQTGYSKPQITQIAQIEGDT